MFWSFTVTLACRALPTLTVFDGTLIATVPTGTTLTLMTADEVIPSIVARIVAVPGASPTTNPPEDTAATAVAVLDHVATRSVSVAPPASFGVAVNCRERPTCTLPEVADNTTDATGMRTGVTVSCALAVTAPTAAVIVVVPGEIAVIAPFDVIVAADRFDDEYVISTPVTVVPLPSFANAAACDCCPTTIVVTGTVSATDATFGVTVMAALENCPSDEAEMATEPTATAVMTPPCVTDATDGFEDVHDMLRPVSATPFASRADAEAIWVSPTRMVALLTAIDTDATGTWVTVSVALPDFPSDVALIFVDPGDVAVTTPKASTDATAAFDDCQLTARPVSDVPCASVAVAMACVVCPGRSEVTPSTTPTDATGAGVTVTTAIAVLPSATAVMVADPTLSPTTRPDDDTVAIDGTRLVHVKVRPLNVPPCASVATAERVVDWPTMTLVAAGVIEIAAIGAGDTVMVDEPEAPATAPKIVAVPGATAFTRPVEETVATPAALVVQVTVDFSAAVQSVAVALAASC